MTCIRALRMRSGLLLVASALLASTAWAQGKPALVRNVDRPEAQPVVGYCAQYGIDFCTLYSVPVGKVLVVEAVSFSFAASPPDPGALPLAVSIASDQGHDLSLNAGPATLAFGNVYHVGTQPVRLIVGENNRLLARFLALRGEFFGKFTFSGYLVDK